MYFKKILGRRIYLSPIDKNDYLKYTHWVNDMDVSIGCSLATLLINEEGEKIALERLTKEPYNFAIVTNNENKLIGNLGFVRLDYINRVGELGIFIGDKNYWNNGYGKEAIELLIDFGFNILNLNNINLKVFSFNHQAIKCYKKIGFREAGRLREAKIIGSQRFDEITMDLLQEEIESPYISNVLNKKRGK